MQQRLNALTNQLASEGIAVWDWAIDDWGLYIRREKLILLRAGMTTPQRLAALTHETIHHYAGHDGHQSAATEARVNREVAKILISPDDYRLAERLHHGSAAGIAYELDLPLWVVDAYRENLERVA